MQNNPDKATRSKKAAEGNIAGLNLLALDGMRVAMTPNVEVSDGWPRCDFRTDKGVLGQPFAPRKSWAILLLEGDRPL
jgi:hypothetical protein